MSTLGRNHSSRGDRHLPHTCHFWGRTGLLALRRLRAKKPDTPESKTWEIRGSIRPSLMHMLDVITFSWERGVFQLHICSGPSRNPRFLSEM